MEASIVDLRYKMNDVLKALSRNEKVKIYYRNEIKGIIIPAHQKSKLKNVKEHPFYGMHKKSSLSVEDEMDKLRGGRY